VEDFQESQELYNNIVVILRSVEEVYRQLIEAYNEENASLATELLTKREKLLEDADCIMEEFDIDYEWPRYSIKKKKSRNIKIIDTLVENCIIRVHSGSFEVTYDKGRLVAKIFDEPYDIEVWDVDAKELIHNSKIEDKHTIDIIEIMESYIK